MDELELGHPAPDAVDVVVADDDDVVVVDPQATVVPDQAVGAPVGPGSLLWKIASDPRSLIPGTAAGIMQLMLPGLGAGVTDHSNFFDDPFDRIFRSIPVIWGSIFADDEDQGATRGKSIRDLHRDIKGVDDQGRRYHALDPDVYWWAHATFTWEFLRASELYLGRRLSRGQQEKLYQETVTWYRRYGVSERPVPPNLEAFRRRFEDVCRYELEMTPAVQWVFDPSTNPAANQRGLPLPGPLAPIERAINNAGLEVMRTLVYGNLPDIVRRRFDLPWSDSDRLAFAAMCTSIRTAAPAIRMGLLSQMWPEGTPHLRPGSRTDIVVAGPSRNPFG